MRGKPTIRRGDRPLRESRHNLYHPDFRLPYPEREEREFLLSFATRVLHVIRVAYLQLILSGS